MSKINQKFNEFDLSCALSHPAATLAQRTEGEIFIPLFPSLFLFASSYMAHIIWESNCYHYLNGNHSVPHA
jgi:hypothetical protein